MNLQSMVNNIFTNMKQMLCKHLFRVKDMQVRNAEEKVKWHCHKCNKIFTGNCGLDILNNGKCDGKCDGKWGEAKYK